MMPAMVMHYDGSQRLALVLMAAGSFLGLACGDDGDPGVVDSTGGETTGTETSTSGNNTISASGMADATEGLDTSGGISSSSSTGVDDRSFLDGMTTEGPPPPMPQPNGSPCGDAEECTSGFCYQIPMLGGVCSECLSDTDCPMGTCSLDPVGYAVCTDGSIGVMCSSDEGCMDDLVCAQLIDTMGLFDLNFCSECNEDTPCSGGQLCAPVYDLAAFQGYLACMDPGSVPNDGGCPLDGFMGEGEVCQSGLCGVADVLGLIPIGVCGECLSDMDCMPMETCTPAAADMSGLQGAVCM
jgi:hypothetical protein